MYMFMCTHVHVITSIIHKCQRLQEAETRNQELTSSISQGTCIAVHISLQCVFSVGNTDIVFINLSDTQRNIIEHSCNKSLCTLVYNMQNAKIHFIGAPQVAQYLSY